MAKKSQRTIVGSPLTPTMLDELGALRDFPPSSEDFKPDGNWINTYLIWTCHGYRESGNQNVGFIRIERSSSKTNKSFTLNVRQEVVEADGIVNILNAEIKSVTSQLGCPFEWGVSSRFIDADGRPIEQLQAEEKGFKKKGVMTVETGGRKLFTRKEVSWLTCDWCVFEFIQRLKFEEQGSLPFDMLEGLTVMKEKQRLYYSGLHQTKIGGENIPLHCFVQLGNGILPFEYWLDDHHRLLLVTSMNKACIFDEKADKITGQEIEKERKAYKKRKSSQRK